MTTEPEEKHSPLYDASRKVLLAAIGAAVLAQDEMKSFIDRLAEQGEIAEKDARSLMREMLERREKIEKQRHAERAKASPNAATKADVEALNQRIADLTRQIEEMKKGK